MKTKKTITITLDGNKLVAEKCEDGKMLKAFVMESVSNSSKFDDLARTAFNQIVPPFLGEKEVDESIVITRKGALTTAKRYIGEDFVGATEAWFDNFANNVNSVIKDLSLTTPLYNGKIICVNSNSSAFTKGKIYEVKNSCVFDDNGQQYCGLNDINTVNAVTEANAGATFIKVVE